MTYRLYFSAIVAALVASGCLMVQPAVTNPIPGLTTVAVAPFINLSAERAVDGRRFALAYASELQKVPGFEVIPVGVTEVAMVDGKLDLNDPHEVLKLAQILRADAVVVGAVTEYSPYYPPRTGMQVNWYSPRSWGFYPGIQIEPATRHQLKDWDRQRRQEFRDNQKKLDDAAAPETPVWQRMYRGFKRWPGVRTLYGEPMLVEARDGCQVLFRGQSPPPSGTQYSSQRPYEEPVNPPKPEQLAGEALRGQNSGLNRGTTTGVRVAHYQELPGMPTPIRLVTTEDEQRPGPSASPAQPLLPLLDPAEPPGEAPADAPPASRRFPSDQSDPVHPRRRDDGLPATPGSADDPAPPPDDLPPSQTREGGMPAPELPPAPLPFDQPEPPIDTDRASPSPPSARDTRPDAPEPPKPPVRDPCLAPPSPQLNPYNVVQPIQPWQMDPLLPLMSYTRVFDGSDADLVAALRDYVELNGDLRSGGWEGYLRRSDDFIRFTSYRMILEMLSLHGGEGKHRTIFKFRRYK